MGVSPIPFIFAQLWFLCAAVRPSIDEEDLGHRASLLLESNEVPAWLECPEEVQEKLRGQLQGLGLLGEGNPCRWAGIWCYNNCTLRSIRSSDATGGLSSVKEMTDLGVLELAGSQITGNVSELAKLKGLCKLDLSHTEVMGDLAELSKLTALTQLRLPHTQVSGNVAELSKLNLFRLDLSQTEVMGDLAELSKLTALEDLRLPHTQVSGNVAELSKLKELRHLDLSRTQVVGDVSVLTNMTKLYDLSLAQSRVHGDFGVISSMPSLEEADLSSTAVSGNLEDLRWGCCKKLRELHLGDAQVRVSPDVSVRRGLLPALRSFNVSGSKLNASVNDLLAFLASTRITSIVAAGCGLTGELPALLAKTPLGTSLQLLDLSGNGLDAVDALLANLRLDVSRNEIPLRVSRDVIKAAAKSGTDLWMMNTELANREEIMANCSNELQLEQMWTPRETGGYSCHDLVRPNIRVTPERFLPKIMCACGPGHFGAGTNCSACPKNTFNDQMDQSKCQACPQGGKAPAGSQALSACKCPYGTPGTFENKTMCRCDRGEALSSDHECRSCGKLHLVCDAPGSLVATAPLEPGHIRLKEPSEEIFECLDRQHCRNSSCAPGRTGLLCASCAQSYRASKKACIECKNVSSERRLSIGLGCATALVIVAATAWTLRRHAPQRSPRSECLLQLIMAQLAALLQLTQLWTVLGALTPDPQATVTADDNAQGDPVLGYLEALQFTSSEVQNFLALQCLYDGITVRSLFALATPLVPLLLLIACGCLEVFSRGLGIRVGLKMLTVLFIGGASGSAQLLGCQRTDGAGTALKEFAFRPLFPHERCEEAIWVDRFGWATAICYGFFIPCFLGFLFAKQNVVMRKVKTVVMHTARNEAKVTVRLQGPKSEESEKDALAQHLKAAAAAYVAVHVKGRATVELQKDATIVTPIEENAAGGSEALGVESLVFGTDLEDAEVLQRHMMVQMLMERRILEEETDRFILGAKQLFCKYAKCENVWMEVCTKVAAAALVSVVAVDNLWLCVAITLGMALVTGLTQPFAQPQMNVLQSACFACLALAAVGFRHHMALARLALAVPFVLLVLQLRRPDSQEMLALRLQQELEAKIHEGPVEVSAEQFT